MGNKRNEAQTFMQQVVEGRKKLPSQAFSLWGENISLMKKIIILMMIAAFLSGCDKEKEETSGGIYGVITDKSIGEPVPTVNVQITPSGKSTVTGSDGGYEFTDLTPDSYTLQINKEGYKPATKDITVTAGKIANGHILIERIPAVVTVDRELLDFGENAGVNTLSFSLVNSSREDLSWKIEQNCLWIKEIKPVSGTLQSTKTETVTVVIDRDKLAGGNNETKLIVSTSDGGSELTVKAVGIERTLPTLNTLDVTNITASTAVFNGKITDAGLPPYTERGFVYATYSTPTIENTIAKLTATVTENTDYSANATGLALDKTYYVRAYAINSAGTAYSSNEVNFATVMLLPEVSTQAVTNINIGSTIATFNGMIISLGDPAYTERGFCYGLVHNPTVDGDTKKTVSGTGLGVYSSNITGLAEGHVYYVRAYVTNQQGTAYGQEVNFDFNAMMPVVTTQEATEISATSAIVHATIVSVGDPAYTERGFVYSEFTNPAVGDAYATPKVVSGAGIGKFTTNLTGLTTETTYYIRAYATSSKGTAYGEQISFIPSSPYYTAIPSVGIMVQKSDISSNTLLYRNMSSLCENSNVGGLTGWRLPAVSELTNLYIRRDEIGGFANTKYWSSESGGRKPQLGLYYDLYQMGLDFATGGVVELKIAAMGDGGYTDYATYARCRCVRTLP
ncbi:MAG: carboxypeptidase regulatory-like domain-containing protein [Prevotellaceae bacterium]|jgi:hypothetical protein|nr:carboxypeptidase regulatory-like domain-containing protein [Prevotellaceae bacterium]